MTQSAPTAAPAELATTHASALGAYAAVLVVLLAWLGLHPFVSALTALSCVGIAALWGAPFLLGLRGACGRTTIALSIVSIACGLACLGVLSLIWRRIGLPDLWLNLLPLAATAILWTRLRGQGAEPGPTDGGWRQHWPWYAGAVAIFLIAASYPLACAWISGSGAYPKTVLSADTGTDLAQLQSLLSSSLIPPETLIYSGIRFDYHFGSIETSAYLVRVTGIAPHIALLYFVLPMWWLAPVASGWIILRRVSLDPRALLLGAGVLAPAAIFSTTNLFKPRWTIVKSIASWIRHGDFDHGPFVRISPFHSTVSAAFAVASAVIMLLPFWHRPWARFLSATLVGILASLSIFWFASMGLLYGIFCLFMAYRERSLRPVFYPALALLIGLAVALATGTGDSVPYSLAIEPFLSKYNAHQSYSLFQLGYATIAICAICCFIPRSRAYLAAVGVFAAYYLALFLIVNLVGFHYGRLPESDPNWAQLLSPTAFILAALAAAGTGRLFEARSKLLRLAFAVAFLAAVPFQVLRFPVVAVQTAANPTGRGDSAFDTATLYDALSHVPTQGTLVVTNDISSPGPGEASKFKTILSGLFGHRFYLTCESVSWRFQPDVETRFRDLAMLQRSVWTAEDDQAVNDRGWTHLLIHKPMSHPQGIPYVKLYENDEYAVYDLHQPGAAKSSP